VKTKWILVSLMDESEDVLNERAEIVKSRIRSGMFGCDAPESPDAWKFTISEVAVF
jgi:hypothetical protein